MCTIGSDILVKEPTEPGDNGLSRSPELNDRDRDPEKLQIFWDKLNSPFHLYLVEGES